ncbi:MAG: penicillin-binding protein 1C [Chthoniobacterales bacterium]
MRRRALQWVLAAFAVVVIAEVSLRCVPLPPALLRPPVQSIALLDRSGVALREARVEDRFSRELRITDIPRHVLDAVLAAEDKRFFQHHGVDWIATGRALTNGIFHGHITSGASTITQQLIKVSERRPRTLATKVIEMLSALRLEQLWSKDQILCAYLNRVDFGHLNIGLSSAADYYFGKPVGDLSEAEAAFLAGIPRNPRTLNPHVAFGAAQKRQQTVLRRMQENGAISAERLDVAIAEPLRLRPPRRLFRAPHFTELVLQQPLDTRQAELRTTLDLALNEQLERILRERLAQLREHEVHNGAAVVIDNASGDVLGLVGSEDYFAPGTGQVNGAWAKRSAGSTLKPFTYLLALERGATPATMVADVRTSFPALDGFYRPENYNRRCYGPVRYRTALGSSLNIPAVKVLLAAGGPAALHQRLRDVGLTTLDRSPEVYGLGLTLGNCEGRLLELTNAYASLARLGEWRPWRVLTDAPSASHRYSRPELVWQIADIMSDNGARTLAFGINSALRFDFPVACKTGTSTDFRDNWTIGFTPEFTVGVWVGNFDGTPMREVSGVTGAGPILHAIFEHLHATRGTSWYPTPPQIVERNIHPLIGKLLSENDRRGVREKFLIEQVPPVESGDDYEADGRVRLSAEYTDWLASAESAIGNNVRAISSELRITSPLPDASYLVDPDVPTSARIPLTASGGEKLVWQSDSLACSRSAGVDYALAVEGKHRITVTDAATGRRAEIQISVKSL